MTRRKNKDIISSTTGAEERGTDRGSEQSTVYFDHDCTKQGCSHCQTNIAMVSKATVEKAQR